MNYPGKSLEWQPVCVCEEGNAWRSDEVILLPPKELLWAQEGTVRMPKRRVVWRGASTLSLWDRIKGFIILVIWSGDDFELNGHESQQFRPAFEDQIP